ncbi:hypothetical protein [Rathayibacter iranicus]|uniref:Peptidase S1 domain-containing protein n=2 Tax=Rathayibacter iranicus TaxID=59737 RepID=A0AAD1AHW0_9MICO|nr:hypothetical protein [Rathayibacter iranicus]AZZ56666.1 hypothetical protein C7V51_12860 [Rathayibacter iranicus]MWV31298.1 hypothetical protein [Rathayibacter iranicus NCPPB 2253 = VKM Ac-1602]PPI43311.1 hypothetical protein C5E09_11780 [Rathayibacter iranicus]PPI58254.1 hypothetical protein C5E08_12695 [Rathayibacter iranicus]PPI69369.1 hypothetical protein C5E01_11740 [Rathayibacter iranicus]
MIPLLLLAALFSAATPAIAQDDVRFNSPLAAGAFISTSTGASCTVGAVLKRTGPGAGVSTYVAATRYLVLAKHCAPKIGETIIFNFFPIATVTWMSATDDVELAEVPPEVTRPDNCSGAHGCFQGSIIAPRAVGRVVISTRGGERAVPMRAPAIPGADERFCTSGAVSHMNCNWMVESDRPANWGDSTGVIARSTNGQSVERGDSGGPVIGEQGQLYGIIQRTGTGPSEDLMQYLPIDELFAQTGRAYEIAPS